MSCLESVAINLAENLKQATPTQQRSAMIAACKLAYQNAQLESLVARNVLEQLAANKPFSKEQIIELEMLVEYLDNKYFSLQKNNQGNESSKHESLKFFTQARAISALLFATNLNTLIGANESIYEASMTLDDNSIIFQAAQEAMQLYS